jgi:HD-like signal output (HDOD) protein
MKTDLKSVINVVGDLPPMPVVAIKVMELLQDPDTTANSLAKAIALDPAVSARILKIANSSFYGLQRQIKTLNSAIVILGEKTLRSLLLAASLKGMNKSFGLLEKMLWEDSVGCAIGARLASQRFQSAEREEAFLAGLFRHIGKVVRNNNNHEEYLQLVQAVYNGEGSFAEKEHAYFPHSHAVVGAAVLEKWNFAPVLIQSTLHHGDMALKEEEDPAAYRLAATVNIAGSLCRRLGIGQRNPEDSMDITLTPGAVGLGVSSKDLFSLLEEFETAFEENRDFFLA